MRAIDRWRALDAQDRRITIRCALTIAQAITIVKVAGVRRALAWAHRTPGHDIRSDDSARRLAQGVDRAGRYVPGATCLARSIALARLLRHDGRAANVVFGTMTGKDFAAHAWVEADGVALTDPRTAIPFAAAVPVLQETRRTGDQEVLDQKTRRA